MKTADAMELKLCALNAMNNPRMETKGTTWPLPGFGRHYWSVSLTAAANQTILTSVFLSKAEIHIMSTCGYMNIHT